MVKSKGISTRLNSVGGGNGIPVITQDQFLAQRGLSSPISDFTLDTTRLPHSETQRQTDRRTKQTLQNAREYSERRRAAINEYNSLVSSGQVRKPTQIENLLSTARGQEDNPAVQAARRSLRKRGYDWRTGQRI